MISAFRLQVAALAVVLAASAAAAQTVPPQQPQTTPSPQTRTVPPGNMWSHGTTLNVFGGAAAASGVADRAAVGGGAMGWEIKPWFALEGSAGWLDWGHNAQAFTAAFTAHVAMLTPRAAVPFLAAGMGLYHTSFDRFDTSMPGFYRRRMSGMSDQASQTTFTDPALIAGGGVELFTSRHWTIRPEVMANVVLRNSQSFVATTGVVRLAYHFEDHPITPNRK